jgi:hypothetical protein
VRLLHWNLTETDEVIESGARILPHRCGRLRTWSPDCCGWTEDMDILNGFGVQTPGAPFAVLALKKALSEVERRKG